MVAPIDIEKLDEILGARVKLRDTPPVNDPAEVIRYAKRCWTGFERCPTAKHLAETALRRLDGLRHNPSRRPVFHIRIARGCDEKCSYCAIRFAVGRFRSKPLRDVLAEFNAGLERGYDLFELLADDVGPYGTDLGTDLPTLLREVFDRRASFRLSLTDVHPRYLIRYRAALIDLLAVHGDRVEVMRVPVQSGSDRILDLMQRPYAVAEVADAVDELRREAPTVKLETHILVGFPGETEADFEETISFLQRVPFDSDPGLRVHRSSAHPGDRHAGQGARGRHPAARQAAERGVSARGRVRRMCRRRSLGTGRDQRMRRSHAGRRTRLANRNVKGTAVAVTRANLVKGDRMALASRYWIRTTIGT